MFLNLFIIDMARIGGAFVPRGESSTHVEVSEQ